MVWLDTWANRIPLVVDHTRVDEDLSDFPLLVSLNDTVASGLVDGYINTELDLDFSGTFTDHWSDQSYTGANAESSYSAGRLALYVDAAGGGYQGTNALSNESWTTASGGIYVLEFDWYPVAGANWYDDDQSDAENKVYFTVPNPTYEPDAWRYWDIDTSAEFIVVKLRSTKSNQITVDTSQTSATTKTFFYSTFHKVKIVLNIDYGTLELYMDGVFKIREDVSAALYTIGANFALNFHWHTYARTGTQYYDNMTFKYYKTTSYPLKIAITKSDGVTQLPVEVASFRPLDTSPSFITRVPTVSSGVDTKLYIYYDINKADNVNYVGYAGDDIARTVWDNDFITVFNLSDSFNDTSVQESTESGTNGTSAGISSGDSFDATFGTAVAFDGSNDYITQSYFSALDDRSSGMTFEFLLSPSAWASAGTHDRIYSQGDTAAASKGYYISINDSGNAEFVSYASADWRIHTSDLVLNLNTFNYLTVLVDDSNEIVFYKNGQTSVNDQISYSYNTPTDSNDVTIAGEESSAVVSASFAGSIDTIRRSKTLRSQSWIKAVSYNIQDQLYTYGAVESAPSYYYHGYVTSAGSPITRTVRLYNRSTGLLMDEATSSGTGGYYYLTTTISGSHYVVVLDDDAGETYNALISDRLDPLGIE